MKFTFDFSAEHIWKSSNGIKYINEDIRIKKTVTTTVQLQRIPHNNVENDTICLKIERYKNSTAELDVKEPKSELTLDSEELENLISFIGKYYKPMELGVDSFIPVDDNQGSNILKRFKELTENDADKAKMILDSGLLNNDISLIIENTKREASLKQFENDLKENFLEPYWQKFFEENKWILGSEYYKILDERTIDIHNIADFLVKSNDGFLDIVEIKKPNGMNFWANTLDHDNYIPSSDLVKAIVQCQNYIHEIETESNDNKFLLRLENTPIASPRCLLVFGRSYDWNEKQWLDFRLLKSSLNRITIIKYDQ